MLYRCATTAALILCFLEAPGLTVEQVFPEVLVLPDEACRHLGDGDASASRGRRLSVGPRHGFHQAFELQSRHRFWVRTLAVVGRGAIPDKEGLKQF